MNTLRARVRNGVLVLEEPTELPEGAEFEVKLVDPDDELDDEEREELHASLAHSIRQIKAGEPPVDGEALIARLRQGQ